MPLYNPNTYAAPIWTVDGAAGSPVAGSNDFTSSSLISATQLNFIIVNKVVEFITLDFTFDSTLGKITRAANQWQTDDKLVVPHKPAL